MRWLAAFAKRRINGVEVSPAITPAEALQRREGLLNSALTIAVRQPEGGSHPLAKRAYLHVKHRTAPTRRGRKLWKATKKLVRGYTGLTGPIHPWLMKRLTGRRTCSKTGRVLNIYFSSKEEIDACINAGGELLQRADDKEETIRNRLEVYAEQTKPLIDHYRARGLLRAVDAEGEMDAVFARLEQAIKAA